MKVVVLAATDWTGLASFVTALCTGLVALVAAVKAHGAGQGVKQVQRDITLPSDPGRPIGAAVDDSRQVQTALVNEYQDLRKHNPLLDRRQAPDRREPPAEPTVNQPLTPEGGDTPQ